MRKRRKGFTRFLILALIFVAASLVPSNATAQACTGTCNSDTEPPYCMSCGFSIWFGGLCYATCQVCWFSPCFNGENIPGRIINVPAEQTNQAGGGILPAKQLKAAHVILVTART
jgi:hypothetical protein